MNTLLFVLLLVGIASIGIGSLAPAFNVNLQDFGIFNSKDELTTFTCTCIDPDTLDDIPCDAPPEATICPQP